MWVPTWQWVVDCRSEKMVFHVLDRLAPHMSNMEHYLLDRILFEVSLGGSLYTEEFGVKINEFFARAWPREVEMRRVLRASSGPPSLSRP